MEFCSNNVEITRCAFASYAISKKHNIDFENVEVLDRSDKNNKRKILEMIQIKNKKKRFFISRMKKSTRFI